jgi:hypothetical protein
MFHQNFPLFFFLLEVTLIDANYTIDETIGTQTISLKHLPYHDKDKQTLQFNKVIYRNHHSLPSTLHPSV